MLQITDRRGAQASTQRVALDTLPGFERFQGAPAAQSSCATKPHYADQTAPGHRSWLGYFQSGAGDGALRYFDRIDSRGALGILVATRALVSPATSREGIVAAVEPSAPGLANSYIFFVGRNALDGFILRVPESERALAEEIHAIAVHRFQEELSAQSESPAARTVAWMSELLTKIRVPFETFGDLRS